MNDGDDQLPELTGEALLRHIAMSGTPTGRAALSTIFGGGEDASETIDALLAQMEAEGKIVSEGRGYRAAKPWADIAYAFIGPAGAGQHVPVHIANLPAGEAPQVTIRKTEIKKHNLVENARIVVRLGRSGAKSPGLQARFIAHADRPFRLVGTFNHSAGRFSPLDRSVKTDFHLCASIPANALPHQFVIELPASFDIREPSAVIPQDQDRDTRTGDSSGAIIARKYDIALSHSARIVREAQNLCGKKLPRDNRTDLCHLDFVTVDPLGATDLDDAFCATIEHGIYAVYTAIADVPAVVPYGCAVDRAAYARGNTFYIGETHRAHMFPECISTRKASLIQNAARPAIVVRQAIDWEGNLIDSSIFPAIIRSREQLSYGQFYDRLERNDPRFRTIAHVHSLRRDMSATMPEMAGLLQEDPGRYTAKSIVETLMVQSNSLIARFLTASGAQFISRNFVTSPADHSATVARAYYATRNLGHDQLGLRHYAHTTSPIRRYADIVNLRALHRALGNRDIGMTDSEIAKLDTIAEHLNARRRVERDIEHDQSKFHAIGDLERLEGLPVRLFINDISPKDVEITISQTGLRQRLPLSRLPDRQWRIDAEHHTLVALDDAGADLRHYRRADTILGKISNIDRARAEWRITLLPPRPDSPARRDTPVAQPA